MARVELPVQNTLSSGLKATYTAATVDGHAFDNQDGKVVLHVKNGGGVAVTVTAVTPGTVDGMAVPDRTVSIPAGEDRFIGTFRRSIYNQDDSLVSGVKNAVVVSTSVQASVSYAALRVSGE
jgi:hypothetical protein